MEREDKAILMGLVVMAWVDGRIAGEERAHIENLIDAFGASDADAAEVRAFASEPRTLADIPITDLSRDDRRVLLNHAVVLSYVDGQQSDDERDALTQLTAALRIPDDEAKFVVEAATARVKRLLSLSA